MYALLYDDKFTLYVYVTTSTFIETILQIYSSIVYLANKVCRKK